MHLSLYAHPFDLQALAARGGLAALRDLGIAEIALAVSYHDGRWLMPWHPDGRVRFLEDGTVHFRPRGDYGVLQPLPSGHVPASGPSPLQALCAAAPAAGLRVRAWTVLTHNSRLGEAHKELCVENAFGDRYPYALCPAQPAVQQYQGAMLRDLAAHAGLHTIELEALGQMGWKHSSHHDKASFAPGGLLEAALSACFCAACRERLAAVGKEPASLRHVVRSFVDTFVEAGCAMSPEGPDTKREALARMQWLNPVLEVRAATVRTLAAIARDATGNVARAVQVHPNPAFTGSQLAAASAIAFPDADERVITAYGEGPDAIGKLLAHDGMRAAAGSPRRLCIWPKAPQFTSDGDLVRVRDLCAQHGIASLAIYHLGLLPWRTLARVAKMFAA